MHQRTLPDARETLSGLAHLPAILAMSAPHFLLLSYPAQGHITPARHLALRMLRATGASVTVSTSISAHRRMFPEAGELEHVDSAGVRYMPYSDGYDDGRKALDDSDYIAHLNLVGPRAVAAVLARLRDAGRPVTRVVYTMLLSWVAGVAREHGVPSVLYWIQSATVLACYFHVLGGTAGATTDLTAAVHVPGLPATLLTRDLPSFLLTGTSDDDPFAMVNTAFRELFFGDHRPTVLANTFNAMEPEAVASLRQHGLDVLPVGPVLSFLDAGPAATSLSQDNDLFKQDGKDYLQWLDERPAGSVVYISFGSTSVMSKRQIAEVDRGMTESGRPFLWVLRKDNPRGDEEHGHGAGAGIVVEWCDQGKVLSHPAVGCFVTHCGWNSTLESVSCGVPVVGVPQWSDQGTNAWLMEQLGTGVRVVVSDKDGILDAGELQRCLGLATSEVVRAKAKMWRGKAREAVFEGGSSDSNLKAAFVAPSN
ncbi:phloretin 4'-O-glucosyltransferase-like [Lolium rigidum]|uniref:phloretin 4'-O-glucosyltransferase-like n=1 Tax=Lolium rigidum TaxID=89674 RepID=UPI001F5C3C2B|nr:phloretin 4'-O-glucosyltransferase-like [Lolium rigidum]